MSTPTPSPTDVCAETLARVRAALDSDAARSDPAAAHALVAGIVTEQQAKADKLKRAAAKAAKAMAAAAVALTSLVPPSDPPSLQRRWKTPSKFWTPPMYLALVEMCLDPAFTNPKTGNPRWKSLYEHVRDASPGTAKNLIFHQYPAGGPTRNNHSLMQKRWKLVIHHNRDGKLATSFGGLLVSKAAQVPTAYYKGR